MDVYLDQLKTAYGNVITALVAAALTPKPNYSIEGQSVSHGEYMRMLIDSAKAILEMWTSLEPYEIRTGTM
jgi:hypothetical protein